MAIYIFLFVLGACMASFIHLYVTRTIKGESIVTPRSHCPKCNHVLKFYELIPIVSFIVQKGRCRKCDSKIGMDSFALEICTGILFVIVYAIYGFTLNTLLGFVIVLAMMSIVLSDFKDMIILDSTIIVSTLCAYIIIFFQAGVRGIYKSFLYGIFGFVLLFVVKILGDAIFKRESLGGGDIKLSFLMGSILPSQLFLSSLFVGSCVALPYALFSTNIKKSKEFAFGPFLMIGLLIVFLFQNDIIKILETLTV